MSQDRKFVIPEEYRVKFQSCFDTMNDKCPLMCWNAGLEYDVNSGEFFIENAKNVLLSLKNYILEALKVCHGEIFGKTVLNEKKRLTEADEASKNLAVESLKAISETLDMLKQNVLTAQDKIKLLSQQGIVAQKLSGLSAQVAASIIDISECITDVTGEQTTKDILNNESSDFIEEDISDDKGVEMNLDTALNNADKIKKFTDQNQNVIIKDDKGY